MAVEFHKDRELVVVKKFLALKEVEKDLVLLALTDHKSAKKALQLILDLAQQLIQEGASVPPTRFKAIFKDSYFEASDVAGITNRPDSLLRLPICTWTQAALTRFARDYALFPCTGIESWKVILDNRELVCHDQVQLIRNHPAFRQSGVPAWCLISKEPSRDPYPINAAVIQRLTDENMRLPTVAELVQYIALARNKNRTFPFGGKRVWATYRHMGNETLVSVQVNPYDGVRIELDPVNHEDDPNTPSLVLVVIKP